MNRPTLSASNLHAAALCPRKPRMEEGIADTDTPESLRGTMLHPYFQTDLDRSGLDYRDQDLMGASDVLSARFLMDFQSATGTTGEEPTSIEHEIELPGLVPGHPDTLMQWRGGDVVAILDLKSGWGEVDDAPDNMQLACYAANQWRRKPFAICGVAIIQPNAEHGKRVTQALYTAEQMPALLDEIGRIYDATLEPDAPLVAGQTQCRFCKAKLTCPEYRRTNDLIPKKTTEELARQMSNDELGKMADAIKLASSKPVKDVVFGELKRRIEAQEIEGWTLKNNGSTTEIEDVKAAFEAMSIEFDAHEKYSAGEPIFADDFLSACDVRVTGLVALVRQLTGESEAKAKKRLETILGDLITKAEKAKSPTRAK